MLSPIREKSEKIFSGTVRLWIYIYLFKGRINRHKERGRPEKVLIEKMIRQVDSNQYVWVDMKRLAINNEEWRTRFATRQGF